ncbi:beta-ketoacyl synthase N-terminal-like domain-containing protein, partial [Xanthomonas arboricola]|uniref:beta-ketoacyl synthase N-terminal-like domain-containing protein n=1 Tax=Xanthomonas arboricola TaxID=56448 RepID=UPI0016229DBE
MRHEIPVSIRNPVVRAHSFDDRYLLPGLAYIDILFQAFTASGVPVDELELRDLAIHRALVVAPDEVVRLRIDASGEGDEWLVHVDGHVDGHDPAKARRYAVATMARRRLAMHVFGQNLDWNAVQSTSAEPLSMQEVYAASALVGLLHGDYMKADGLVYTTDEAIYVDCQLGADARADADDVLFHPALVDACVVGATAVLSTLDPNGYEAALPLSYGRFAASRPLGGACMARVMRDGVRRENGLTWLSMDFFDLEGRQIAELRDFASKRLPPSRRLAHDDDDGGAGDLAAGPPSPSKTEAAPTVDASLLATFVRDAIARRLRIDAAAIRGDIDFYELGIDSTGLLELAHAIQAHLHRKLPPTLLFQFSTIDEVVAHLVETAASAIFVAGPKPSATPAVTSTDERRDDDIAVVGLCGRFPQAGNVERFWEKLCAGADCIGMVPAERWDVVRYFDPRKGEPGKTYGKWGGFIEGVDAFDPLFFGMSPREAELTDPQQRLFLETVWNLLEECGYTRERLRSTFGGSVGVYVGSMYSQYDHLSPSSPTVLQSFQSAIANRVSHYFGLNGPSVAVDTMCSSFAVALHQACADLRRGDVAMAIAGAVNLSLDARKFVALSQALLLASRFDARSFADGDGYFPSETVGAVLLKPLRTAERDGDAIWGVIRATAVNHAGSGQAYSVPNGQAQVGVMCDVLRRANVEAGAIGYVEAAATGAAIGDAIEWGAIAQVFDGQPCAIGSVKSNMGHAEAASGFSQLAKVLLQLRHG